MPLIRTLSEDFALRNAEVVWHGGMKSPLGGFTKGELLSPRDEQMNPIYRGAAPQLGSSGAFSSTPRVGTVADVAGVRQ